MATPEQGGFTPDEDIRLRALRDRVRAQVPYPTQGAYDVPSGSIASPPPHYRTPIATAQSPTQSSTQSEGRRSRFTRRKFNLAAAAGVGGGAVVGGTAAVVGGERFGLLFFAHDRDKGRYVAPEQRQEDWMQQWVNRIKSAEYPNVIAAKHGGTEFVRNKVLPLALQQRNPLYRENWSTPIGVHELYFHHWRLIDRKGRAYKQVYTDNGVTFSDLDFGKLAPRDSTVTANEIQFFRPYNSVDVGRNDRVGSIPALISADALPKDRFVFAFARQINGGAWEEQQVSAFEVTVAGSKLIFINLETYSPLHLHPYHTLDPHRPTYNKLAILITDKDGEVVNHSLSDQMHWGSISPQTIHIGRIPLR